MAIALKRATALALTAMALAIGAGAQANDATVAALQSSVQNSISAVDRSLVAVVAIGSGGPMVVGSGFVVSEDGIFITAAHVLRQPAEVQTRALIRDVAGKQKVITFDVLLEDEQRDVAVCRMVAGHGMRPPVVPARLAGSSKASAGTLVVASGFPLASERPSSHLGIVSSSAAGDDYVEIAVMVNEGESGAPVVRLDDGRVIGMVSSVRTASTFAGAGRGVEDQNSGLTIAAPSEWLAMLVANAKQRATGAR